MTTPSVPAHGEGPLEFFEVARALFQEYFGESGLGVNVARDATTARMPDILIGAAGFELRC